MPLVPLRLACQTWRGHKTDRALLKTFGTRPCEIVFDMIADTMYETGKDLRVMYRETAEGGLAKNFKQ